MSTVTPPPTTAPRTRGERLEARTLARLSLHKREALGDVGKRLSQLGSRRLYLESHPLVRLLVAGDALYKAVHLAGRGFEPVWVRASTR